MNVVDSSAWLEYFANGPNADRFADVVSDIKRLVVPSITLLEVFKRILQQRDETVAFRAVAAMRQGRIVDLDTSLALAAAKLGFTLKLALAESVILATARRHRAVLWTQDPDFEGVEGVRYFPKVGQRP